VFTEGPNPILFTYSDTFAVGYIVL